MTFFWTSYNCFYFCGCQNLEQIIFTDAKLQIIMVTKKTIGQRWILGDDNAGDDNKGE